MSRDNNWPAYGADGVNISAVTGSAPAVALPQYVVGFDEILVYNPGPFVVRIKCGNSDVEATALSMPVLPGISTFDARQCTHISALAEVGAQEIQVFRGEGA